MNHEPNPWLMLWLRLSDAEVLTIARRGAVTGKVASRILEAVAEECDEFIRFQHGQVFTRRERRRQTRRSARERPLLGLRGGAG